MHLPEPARDILHALRAHLELRALAALAFIAAALWAAIALGDEVLEGDTRAFDETLLLALRDPADPAQPLGPPIVQELMRDFTALGGVLTLILLTLAAAGFLLLLRQRGATLLLLVAVGGGWALSAAAKALLSRPRPDLVPHGSFVHTASFPSGHSMLSAVTYLTLAVLVARTLPNRAVKVYVVAVAALLSLGVGVSRVYLGVHWPTDVLAGWAAGAAWAVLCAFAAAWLARRGQIEPAEEGEAGGSASS